MAGGLFNPRDSWANLPPTVDDTYWLGDDTHGWKGLKLPDLVLYQKDANSLALENIGATIYKDFYLGDALLHHHATDTVGTFIKAYKARGTKAAPSTVVSGDDILTISGYAHDGTNYLYMAGIKIETEGTIATTRTPTKISFWTATNAAPSVLTERLTINSAGLATFTGGISTTIFTLSSYQLQANGAGIYAFNADNNFFVIKAQDNTVGLVEVARVSGAVDPYMKIGRNDTGVALNAVTDMLILQAGASTYSADFNYGLAKYHDFKNQNFHLTAFECVGRSGANDTGFNIKLLYHSATGWTYSAAAFVSGGTVLANMNTDYVTEKNLSNGLPFAYKRTDLSQEVAGDSSEGVVVEVTTGANKSVDRMNILIKAHTVPLLAPLDSTEEALKFIYSGSNWCQL